jgi:hypothetical protein
LWHGAHQVAQKTALEHAVASGFGYTRWYVVSIDPAFAAGRDTPRFKTLTAKLAAHAKDEQAAVEQLRRERLVPAATASP